MDTGLTRVAFLEKVASRIEEFRGPRGSLDRKMLKRIIRREFGPPSIKRPGVRQWIGEDIVLTLGKHGFSVTEPKEGHRGAAVEEAADMVGAMDGKEG